MQGHTYLIPVLQSKCQALQRSQRPGWQSGNLRGSLCWEQSVQQSHSQRARRRKRLKLPFLFHIRASCWPMPASIPLTSSWAIIVHSQLKAFTASIFGWSIYALSLETRGKKNGHRQIYVLAGWTNNRAKIKSKMDLQESGILCPNT